MVKKQSHNQTKLVQILILLINKYILSSLLIRGIIIIITIINYNNKTKFTT